MAETQKVFASGVGLAVTLFGPTSRLPVKLGGNQTDISRITVRLVIKSRYQFPFDPPTGVSFYI